MIRQFWVSRTEKIFKIIQIVGTFSLTILGAALYAKPENFSGWTPLKQFLEFNQASAFASIPIISLLVGGATFFKTHFGSINTWNTVASLLEEYKKAVTEGRAEYLALPDYHIRITLYKYVGFRFAFCRHPFTGWMVPVARTGHTTISWRIPRFRAPVSDPDNAEGVAGRVFVQKKIMSLYGLPDLSVDIGDVAFAEYAERGFVSTKWLRKRKSHTTRSLLGVPIEVKNKPWGSLVIDCREPDEISTEETLNTLQYRMLANVLGKLLEN